VPWWTPTGVRAAFLGAAGAAAGEAPPPFRRLARTGTDGGFELTSLQAGRWALHAAREDHRADAVVDLLPDEVRSDVTLHLRDAAAGGTLDLWLTDADGGPAAGAEVHVWASAEVPLGQPLFFARTADVRGLVQVPAVAGDAGTAGVSVRLAGRPWTAVRTALTGSLGLALAPAGGDLRFRVGASPRDLRQLALVTDDGAFLRLVPLPGRVAFESSGDCTVVEVRNVAAGRWRLASTARPLALRELVARGAVVEPVAAPVVLEPGAVTELAVLPGWRCSERRETEDPPPGGR
jgi:hypothetical protein